MHAGDENDISSLFSSSARVWGHGELLLALRGEWRVGDLLGGLPRCWVFSPLPTPYSLIFTYLLFYPLLSSSLTSPGILAMFANRSFDRFSTSRGIRVGVGLFAWWIGWPDGSVGVAMATSNLFEVGPCCGGPVGVVAEVWLCGYCTIGGPKC
jgi:hypothetical protein